MKQGAKTYEFTYSNYKDWNNPLNPAEAFYAGRMIEKQNGAVVRDITTTLTETGQMYVVMPVPASVKAAIKPTNQPPNWTLNADAPPTQTQTAAAVTPRLADGHPDMTGNWGGPPLAITGSGNPPMWSNAGAGWGNQPRGRLQNRDKTTSGWIMSGSRPRGLRPELTDPIYKPEFWDKIQELDQWTNKYDPVMTCQPLGLPRQGTPTRIIQTDDRHHLLLQQHAITAAETRNSATSRPTAARARRRSKPITTGFRSVNGRATRW